MKNKEQIFLKSNEEEKIVWDNCYIPKNSEKEKIENWSLGNNEQKTKSWEGMLNDMWKR